ncbi:MAG: competence protein ComFB [Spirochaetales bacterium]|nr:MAG: competence protein ComFB [Spirochaetales bacterium]
MDIHNLMEELVKTTVNEMFDAETKESTGSWCTCWQCRVDVACYVLNKLKPEYVLSGRGVAYSEMDYTEKLQTTADVVSLAREGWTQINLAKRPNHSHDSKEQPTILPVGPVFNLPPIKGRLFNGNNFEPISSGSVSLIDDKGIVRMMDANWQNPFTIAANTAGTFIFWPYPIVAAKVGEARNFSLTISAELPGYEPLSHFLELEVRTEESANGNFSMQALHRLPDLYVFPK